MEYKFEQVRREAENTIAVVSAFSGDKLIWTKEFTVANKNISTNDLIILANAETSKVIELVNVTSIKNPIYDETLLRIFVTKPDMPGIPIIDLPFNYIKK